VVEPAEAAEEARARAYHRRRLALSLLDLVGSAIYLLALVETHAARHLADLLAPWAARWWVQVALVLTVLACGYRLAIFPLAWLSGFWLRRRYGLLHQPFGHWLWDAAKAGLLGGIVGLLAAEILYGLLRLTPFWWVWGAVVFLIGHSMLALIAPVLLVPLFYRLTPIPEGSLKARLLALARRVGVPVSGIWMVDQSRKSRTANAAVTGLGRTRRILLSDTLIQQFAPDEVEAVLAHELAHHLHHDVPRGLLVQGVLTLATFWVADCALRLGVGPLRLEGPADVAGLPLFGLILLILSLAALPLGNGWSRHVERRADRFALETIPDASAFIRSMERLAALNLAQRDPHPLEEFLLYSHPSVGRRIASARQFLHSLT
jgi:STE24 endopeptidase